MKKLICTVLVVAFCLAVFPGNTYLSDVKAEEISVSSNDTWEWEEYTYNGETGVMLTNYKGNAEDIYIPGKIYSDDVNYNVLKLGDELFKNNNTINSATLGEGIKEIGASAFEGATNLVCIVTNETIETIGNCAFKNCTEFNSIILYDAVTNIGTGAFDGCGKITIYCNENNTAHGYAVSNGIEYVLLSETIEPETVEFDGMTFYLRGSEGYLLRCSKSKSNYVEIPPNVNGVPIIHIVDSAFSECRNIRSIKIPTTVKSIGKNAFDKTRIFSLYIEDLSAWCKVDIDGIGAHPLYCVDSGTYGGQCKFYINGEEATDIVIPPDVEQIKDYTFHRADINSVTINSNVTSIGKMSFYYSGVKRIHLNTYVKELNYWCFADSLLEDINLPENLETINEFVFYNCKYLKDITIPDSVTKIEQAAFSGCASLTSVVLPNNVSEIGASAFNGCNNVQNLVISESLEEIPGRAFSGCKLSELIIPDNIKSIGSGAFAGNTPLKSIDFGTGLTSIGCDAFRGCGFETLVIPSTIKNIGIERDSNGRIRAGNSFASCKSLKSVFLSEGTHIGSGTFKDCTSLEEVHLAVSSVDANSNAFENCTALKEVEIPYGVTSVYNLFPGCTALEKITIPSTVKLANIMINNTENLTIYCENRSDAMIYALQHSIPYVLIDSQLQDDEIIEDGIIYKICENHAEVTGYTQINGTADIQAQINNLDVTVIRQKAFYYCKTMTAVKIPATITSIEAESFSECTNLDSVYITDLDAWCNIGFGMQPLSFGCDLYINDKIATDITIKGAGWQRGKAIFMGCTSIVSVTVSGGGAYIGDDAFNNCTNLQRVSIGYMISDVGKNAFKNCKNLTEINFDNNSVTRINNEAFSGCSSLTNITFPSSLQYIYYRVFNNCNSLNNVIFNEGLEEFYDSFENCTALTDIHLPSTLKRCGSFKGCTNLRNINIPEEVTALGGFENCENLTNITIPNKVTKIPSNCFRGCKGLTGKFIIPDGVTEIGSWAFSQSNFTEIQIPQTVTSIGQGAFSEAAIETIDLPDIDITMPDVFSGCHKLKSFIFPSKMTYIPGAFFSGCSSLEEIIIPEHIKSVNIFAFRNCSGLRKIVFKGDIDLIGTDQNGLGHVFAGCENLQVIFEGNCGGIGSYAFAESNNVDLIFNGNVDHFYSSFVPGGKSSITFCGDIGEVASDAFSAINRINICNLEKWYAHDFNHSKNNPCYYTSELSINGNVINNIIIPDGIEKIGSYQFDKTWGIYKDLGITYIYIPESVQEISDNAFVNFSNTVYCVYDNSYALNWAINNLKPYFIIKKTSNPEISYGTSISGTVQYADGTAVSGATVDILYDDGAVKETVTTDSNGEYSFTYAEVGRYTVRAADASGNTSRESVSVKRMNVFDVYVSGETNLVLKQGYNVSGTVSDAATVSLTDEQGNIISSTETAENSFDFCNISNGTYILKAESENGSITEQITVFNADVTGIYLELPEISASVNGTVLILNRDETTSAKAWADVKLYDENGIVISQTRTDGEGAYSFENIPVGDYSITAEAYQMRPDIMLGYQRNHKLTGYAHESVTQSGEYTVDPIILKEQHDEYRTGVSGKITANGTTQDCKVILTDTNGNQVAVYITDKNGKYSFINILDGSYCLSAETKADGCGYSIITIENGVVYGATDIHVVKADKIARREQTLFSIPECTTKADAIMYKEVIATEKQYYDGLSEKEKKQFSAGWVELLYKLIGLISESSYTIPDGIALDNAESIISADEINSEETFEFVLNVTETSGCELTEDGITSNEEYIQQLINDTAGDSTLIKYYDISLSKNGQTIKSVSTNTDTTGKLTITMEIPDEYKGHKHYSFIHEHNGEAVTLADLDRDPDTVTFEVNRFSQFALAYSDVELTAEDENVYAADITYNSDTGKILVSSPENGKLYIGTYSGDRLTAVEVYDIPAGTESATYDFNSNQIAFIWNDNVKPLCPAFSIE